VAIDDVQWMDIHSVWVLRFVVWRLKDEPVGVMTAARGARSNDKWCAILTPTTSPDEFLIEPGVHESGEHAVLRRLPDGRVA
jgi:hypothetical protein